MCSIDPTQDGPIYKPVKKFIAELANVSEGSIVLDTTMRTLFGNHPPPKELRLFLVGFGIKGVTRRTTIRQLKKKIREASLQAAKKFKQGTRTHRATSQHALSQAAC